MILPLLNGPRMLMNRNLLYTAVTRARSCVTIVGSPYAVNQMIDNKYEQIRYTSLRQRICEFVIMIQALEEMITLLYPRRCPLCQDILTDKAAPYLYEMSNKSSTDQGTEM